MNSTLSEIIWWFPFAFPDAHFETKSDKGQPASYNRQARRHSNRAKRRKPILSEVAQVKCMIGAPLE
jgi:hypothetical protein